MAPPLRQVTLKVTLKVGVALKKHEVMFVIIYVSVRFTVRSGPHVHR